MLACQQYFSALVSQQTAGSAYPGAKAGSKRLGTMFCSWALTNSNTQELTTILRRLSD